METAPRDSSVLGCQMGEGDRVGRHVEVKRGGSPATRWEVAIGVVDPRLGSLLDPYGGYVECAARRVIRREVPVPRTSHPPLRSHQRTSI